MSAPTPDEALPAPRPDTSAGLRLPDTLHENLQLIADGVVAVAGFAAAAIRIRRGDDLVLVVDTGRPEEIGSRLPVQTMVEEIALSDDWGILRFVPHEKGTVGEHAGWVVRRSRSSRAPTPGTRWTSSSPPCTTRTASCAAPGHRRAGRRTPTRCRAPPGAGALRRLASRSVLSAVERESLAAQVAMADTVKSIVRTTSAQLSLAGLVEASERTLLEGFGAQRVWIKTVADAERSSAEFLPDDLSASLPPRSWRSPSGRPASAGTSRPS